jgi:ABC-type amino acid transport substrate-binding protein
MENQVQSSQPIQTQQDSTPIVSSPPSNEPPKHSNKNVFFAIFFILLFLGGLVFAVWYFQSQLQKNNATALDNATKVEAEVAETLIVGTDPNYKPMEYMENGTMVGYDIDLANFLAQELKTQVEFKNIAFDDLFGALEKEEIDLIISGVTITDERKQKYDFSKEYLNAGQVIITKKDNTSIQSTADLKGKKISVQKGTTNETEALKYTDDVNVVRFEDFEQATKALVDNKADAVFTDLPNAKGIIVANPTLKIASDPFINQYYGIVLRKNDPRLNEVNAALESLRVKGILTDLKQKWLE